MRCNLTLLVLTLLAGCAQRGPSFVEADLLPHTSDGAGPYQFRAVVQSDTSVKKVIVRWSEGQGDSAIQLEGDDEVGVWRAPLEGRIFPLGTRIEYWFEARDTLGARAYAPANAPGGSVYSYTVGPWPYPAVIEDVQPERGSNEGGTEVLVYGTGFRPDTELWFGLGISRDVTYVSPRLLRAVTPPGPGGEWVTLRGEDGQGHKPTMPLAFYYFADPEPAEVVPPDGPYEGGDVVRVLGDHFLAGATIQFDGRDCVDVGFVSEQELTCRAPAHPGPRDRRRPVDVRVENRDGLNGTLKGGYTYNPPPVIDQVIPSTGPSTGGTTVRIRGSVLLGPVEVTFDGAAATDCEVIDEATIRCVTPPGELGPADVVVRNRDGQTGALLAGFLYHRPAPEVLGVEPPLGPDEGGTRVAITGSFFQDGVVITFAGRRADCAFVTTQQVLCITPPGSPGLADVRATNPDGQGDTLDDAYHFIGPPQIDSVEPARGTIDGGTRVVIRGTYLDARATVTFDGVVAEVREARDEDGDGIIDTLVVVTPPHQLGLADVRVRRADGELAVAIDAFEYVVPPPEITQLDPSSGGTWGGTTVIIHGRSFRRGAQVTFDGVGAIRTTVIDSTTLEVVTPSHAEGAVEVAVWLPTGETASAPDAYRYVLPSVLPSGGLTAGFTNVTIQGVELSAGTTLRIGGRAVGARFENFNQLTAVTLPSVGTGAVDLTVTLPDGRAATRRGAFTYRRFIVARPDERLAQGDCNEVDAGDLNGDDAPDLAISMGGIQGISVAVSQVNKLLFNEGGLELREVDMPGDRRNTTNLSLGDVEGDGDLDILETNLEDGDRAGNRLWLNDGGGTLNQAPFERFPNSDSSYDGDFTDVDLDGDLDVILANNAGRERLLLNDGAGNFTDRSERIPDDSPGNTHDHDMDLADLNGDDLPDMIFSVDNVNPGPGGGINLGANRVLLNQGDGFMAAWGTPMEAMRGDMLDIDALDVDGDGDLDIIGVNMNAPTNLYLNDGFARFTLDATGRLPVYREGTFEVSSGDVDNDGDLDLALSNLSLSAFSPGQRNHLLVNDGAGRFHDADVSWVRSSWNTTETVFVDLDGDGLVELFVCNYDSRSELLRQDPL